MSDDIIEALELCHLDIERDCWHQHHDNFDVCLQAACALLKRVALASGWIVDENGVRPKPINTSDDFV